MKIILTFATCFFTTFLLFISCKKDQQTPTVPLLSLPPVARAGADTAFTLLTCTAKTIIALNGSNSSDPQGKNISGSWRSISGRAEDFTIRGINGLYTALEIRRAGVFSFELLIANGTLTSKDTVTITAIAATPKEYDLDITSNTTYIFRDNYEDCSDEWGPCTYVDKIEIRDTVTFAPMGLLNFRVDELSDTANLSYSKASYFNIYKADLNSNVYGSTSINFKKLIQQGGGAFNGIFNVTEGSANGCDPNIYKSQAPLAFTGNLDTTTKKVLIRIKGKTFF